MECSPNKDLTSKLKAGGFKAGVTTALVSDFPRNPGKEQVGKTFSFGNATDIEKRQQSALSCLQHGLRMPRRTLGEATKTPPLPEAACLTTATWRMMASPDLPSRLIWVPSEN